MLEPHQASFKLVQVLLPPHLCRSACAQPLQPTDPHPTPHADSKQEERNTADDWCGNHPCRHGGLCKRVLGSKSEALEQTHQHLRFPGDHSAEYYSSPLQFDSPDRTRRGMFTVSVLSRRVCSDGGWTVIGRLTVRDHASFVQEK